MLSKDSFGDISSDGEALPFGQSGPRASSSSPPYLTPPGKSGKTGNGGGVKAEPKIIKIVAFVNNGGSRLVCLSLSDFNDRGERIASKCCGGLIGAKKEANRQKNCIATKCSTDAHLKNKVDWSVITTCKIDFSPDKNMFLYWQAGRRMSFDFT